MIKRVSYRCTRILRQTQDERKEKAAFRLINVNYLTHIVVEENSGNLFAAAKMLGISRSTLYRKIKVLKI